MGGTPSPAGGSKEDAAKDELIEKYKQQVDVLVDEVSRLKEAQFSMALKAKFGDIVKKVFEQIIKMYEVGQDNNWSDFWSLLERERRKLPDDIVEALDVANNLKDKTQHRILFDLIDAKWSPLEYELLYRFRDDRNETFHSGYRNLSIPKKRTFLAEAMAILQPVGCSSASEGDACETPPATNVHQLPEELEQFRNVLSKGVGSLLLELA